MSTEIIETTKTGLTIEEKRQKRNEYARRYYETHKDRIKAICKKSRAMKKAIAAEDERLASQAVQASPVAFVKNDI